MPPDVFVEAEARVKEACVLLIRGDVTAVAQAAACLESATEILKRCPGAVPGAPSPRRLALHRAVQRAGKLLQAIGQWCEYRRGLIFPEEDVAPCYGSDGRERSGPAARSVAVEG